MVVNVAGFGYDATASVGKDECWQLN